MLGNQQMMSGMFGANRLRGPFGGGGQAMPPPQNGQRIMPMGSPMGPSMPPQDGPQNSIMPQGAPMGPKMGPQPGGDPSTFDQQIQQPLTQAEFSSRAPIMNPNNNFMMDALKSGSQAPQTPNMGVGTPQSNTPGINMQNMPFFMQQMRQQQPQQGMPGAM